ncbi:MAG TPA: hypothetical protein PK745_00545 [bacterium]|nr:hypothetical protein [bacterium]
MSERIATIQPRMAGKRTAFKTALLRRLDTLMLLLKADPEDTENAEEAFQITNRLRLMDAEEGRLKESKAFALTAPC